MGTLTVPSGAEVVINVAAWKDAKELKKAIERVMAQAGSISIEAVLLVDSNDAVETALFACLQRCTYNNEKITSQTFDAIGARADYYDIISACIKENLSPLAESLRSKLQEHGLLKPVSTDVDQKSESATK